MEPRLKLHELTPQVYRRMGALESAVHELKIEPALYELIKIRASQLNGCAFCLDMHTKDARAAGETEQRIYGLSAWREAPFYSDRERAALALTEEVTLISRGPVSDEVYDAAARHFTEEELAAIIWAIAAINVWNRLAITTGSPEPGSCQPPQR